VDGGCLLEQVLPLAIETRSAQLSLQAIHGPLPEEHLPPGRRLPFLAAADDREERLAAQKLLRRAIEGTRDLGVGLWGLDFGQVPLEADETEIRTWFARRELDDGEPGHARLVRAVAQRRRRGPALLDACRSSLDAAIKLAERHQLTLALRLAGTPWEVPSPREAATLLAEYAGAPIGVVHSPARLALLGALGLGVSAPLRQLLREAARLVEAADAVGLEYPLLAGLGEADLADLRPTATTVPVVLSGPPDAPVEEVRAARSALEAT
jgi:hypothetical protein